jgi:hypothetical protein
MALACSRTYYSVLEHGEVQRGNVVKVNCVTARQKRKMVER